MFNFIVMTGCLGEKTVLLLLTRSSIALGGLLPISSDSTSLTVMNSNGFSTEPWCRSIVTSKLFIDHSSVLTDAVHPSYICMYVCISFI